MGWILLIILGAVWWESHRPPPNECPDWAQAPHLAGISAEISWDGVELTGGE